MSPGRASPAFLRWLAASWAAIVAVSAIHAVNPVVWGIENGPVLCAFAWLFATRKSRTLSVATYLCCTLFLALHEVGAHYTYLRVPFGYWLESALGWTRNDYDRVVHFAFGVTCAIAAWEAFRGNIRGSKLPLYMISFSLVMWLSALYEIAEAYVIVLAPGAGTQFLATQGDNFDSQNDMASAMLGCLLCLLGIAIRRTRAKAA